MSVEQVIPNDELTKVLFALGYFGARTWAEVEQLPDSELAEQLIRYQHFHGVEEEEEGLAGPVTAHSMRRLRCALPDFEMREEGKICQWPMKLVTYYPSLRLPGLTPEQVIQAFDEACGQWTAVCGLSLQRVATTSANILAKSGTGRANGLDGRGGTLAWSELPCNVRATDQMNQCYDEAEAWNYRMAVAVICHEIGHALGLPHLPNGNLMAPYYDPKTTKPQAGDIQEMVQRYGPAVSPAPNPNPPAPNPPAGPGTPSTPGAPGAIDVSGLIYIQVGDGPKLPYVLVPR